MVLLLVVVEELGDTMVPAVLSFRLLISMEEILQVVFFSHGHTTVESEEERWWGSRNEV